MSFVIHFNPPDDTDPWYAIRYDSVPVTWVVHDSLGRVVVVCIDNVPVVITDPTLFIV